MAARRRNDIERGKGIYTKGWEIKSENNPVAPWYASSRISKEVEDDRAGDEELLVARSNKRCGEIYGGLWYVPEDKKQNRRAGRKVEVEWDARETVNILDSGLYH